MKTRFTEARHESLRGSSDDAALTELANAFGSDKGTRIGDWGTAHGYTRIYEHFLAPRRFESLKLLEIGVWKGASLRMWERYLPETRIVGVDILPDAQQAASERSRVIVGDASDRDFLRQVVDTCFDGTVDVVVDDGSHVLDHQLAALETLFPLLSEGGLYFIEDISVSRFDIKSVTRQPFADFLDYAAWLAEQTTFWDETNTQQYHTIQNLNSLAAAERDRITPNYWNGWLDAVHLFYNMCILEKRRRELPIRPVTSVPSVVSRSAGRNYALRALRERFREVESGRSGPFAELLAEAKEKLASLEIQVTVATKLAQHSDSIPAAINAAVEYAQCQIGPFRDALRAIESASSGVVAELSRATLDVERAMKKLNRAEAELEYLRDRLNRLQAEQTSPGGVAVPGVPEIAAQPSEPAVSRAEADAQIDRLQVQLATLKTESAAAEARYVEADAQIDRLQVQLATLKTESAATETRYVEAHAQIDRLQVQLATLKTDSAATETRYVEAEAQIDRLQVQLATLKAESAAAEMGYVEAEARIDRLEMELARGSAEIAQIRLIHAGMWDSWKSATAELERSAAKCQMLEQEIGDLRWRAAERDVLMATVNALYASTSWRVTAPLRWLRLALSRQQ